MLITGSQNNISFIKTLHTRIQYFSREHRVVSIDNLIPYEALDEVDSAYLFGQKHDTLKIQVIITPFPQSITQDSPPLDFK